MQSVIYVGQQWIHFSKISTSKALSGSRFALRSSLTGMCKMDMPEEYHHVAFLLNISQPSLGTAFCAGAEDT